MSMMAARVYGSPRTEALQLAADPQGSRAARSRSNAG